MEKYYKLSQPLYGKSDHVRVCSRYDKKAGGYIACVEALEKSSVDGIILWGKAFCREYYESGGDGIDIIVVSARRNAKKEMAAGQIVSEKASEYVRKFLDHKGKTDFTFEEVEGE
jgi:hypothetical protein